MSAIQKIESIPSSGFCNEANGINNESLASLTMLTNLHNSQTSFHSSQMVSSDKAQSKTLSKANKSNSDILADVAEVISELENILMQTGVSKSKLRQAIAKGNINIQNNIINQSLYNCSSQRIRSRKS